MKKLILAAILLPALAMLAMSCSQTAVAPEDGPGDKRSFPGSSFMMSLTQEHLEAVWNQVMTDPSHYDEIVATINYYNTGGRGNYVDDRTFPGMDIGTDVNDFVIEATATVEDDPLSYAAATVISVVSVPCE